MDQATAQKTDDSIWAPWVTAFSGMFKGKRGKTVEQTLDRAARLIADSKANPNEREMSLRQLQAALEVDPNLVLTVLAAVRGPSESKADIEKLRTDAARATSDFEGLTRAVQTLRASLSKTGMIASDARLPETVEEWNSALEALVQKKTAGISAREARLARQHEELETRRAEVLAEIEAAQRLLETRVPALEDKTGGVMLRATDEISHLFQQEIARVVGGAARNVEALLVKRAATLIDQTSAKIAKAKGTIAGLSFGFDRVDDYEIGQSVEGEGIFAGIWEPKDRQGKSLNKKYAVFAAPEDFTDSSGKKILLTFQATATELAKRKNWHGHDGGNYKNDAALYKAFKNGSYKGEWFIPTRDLLLGTDIDGNKVHEESLFKNKNTGDFAGTYTESSSDFAYWYWSCSEPRDYSDYVWVGRFSDGGDLWDFKDNYRLSCRPCRVVELVI